MSGTLESKHYPKIFYAVYMRHLEAPSDPCMGQYELATWEDLKPGDQAIIVEDGMYKETVKGVWKSKAMDEKMVNLDSLNIRPYRFTNISLYLFSLLEEIEIELPDFHVKLLKYFGFDHGDVNLLKEEVEKSIKLYPNLSEYLQGIYSAI